MVNRPCLICLGTARTHGNTYLPGLCPDRPDRWLSLTRATPLKAPKTCAELSGSREAAQFA